MAVEHRAAALNDIEAEFANRGEGSPCACARAIRLRLTA